MTKCQLSFDLLLLFKPGRGHEVNYLFLVRLHGDLWRTITLIFFFCIKILALFFLKKKYRSILEHNQEQTQKFESGKSNHKALSTGPDRASNRCMFLILNRFSQQVTFKTEDYLIPSYDLITYMARIVAKPKQCLTSQRVNMNGVTLRDSLQLGVRHCLSASQINGDTVRLKRSNTQSMMRMIK